MDMTWREAYYEDGYLRRWRLDPPSADHLREAASLLRICECPTGARVLDLGCGHGRYSVGFARAGAAVVGVDASWALLRRAVAQAPVSDQRLSWVRADMRALPLRAGFDLVVLIDAFGYFDHPSDEPRVLGEIHRALSDGGVLAMRNPNAVPIREDFQIHGEEVRHGVRTTIDRSIDSTGRMVHERLTIEGPQGVGEFERRQRIYDQAELDAVLAQAGFAVQAHYAGLRGESFNRLTSPRMITVATRGGRRPLVRNLPRRGWNLEG